MVHPVVGFDLDMTLVDSAEGILATLEAVGAELGQPLDRPAHREAARATIGLPLEAVCASWLPPELVGRAVARYRELYPSLGIPRTTLLPGAAAAVDSVRAHGGRVVVVSAKVEPAVRAVLAHVGLEVDAVEGGRYGAAKGAALRAHGATVHVGDHPGDVEGAHAAGALAVAVPTGPHDAGALAAAGAEVVLRDLRDFPAWFDGDVLDTRLAALEARLREAGSLLVAFSGGADSALVLAAAVRALVPERVVAATAVSASLPAAELDAAAAFAQSLGVRHLTPRTDEMAREGYRANSGDRCFFCKAELLEVLDPLRAERGLAAVATGTNADDAVAGFRPGIRAAAERGAMTPLLDAGLTKAQVREASRRWGLPTWDKPAAACLSSRVAYGIAITPTRLVRVERAEAALRSVLAAAGVRVRDLRVRDLGDRARVDVDTGMVGAVRALPEALAAVRDSGFSEVEVDPRGFRSGSMNELLTRP